MFVYFNKHNCAMDKNDKSNRPSVLVTEEKLFWWFHDIRTPYRQYAIRLLHTFFF